jgi:hypothetical protein
MTRILTHFIAFAFPILYLSPMSPAHTADRQTLMVRSFPGYSIETLVQLEKLAEPQIITLDGYQSDLGDVVEVYCGPVKSQEMKDWLKRKIMELNDFTGSNQSLEGFPVGSRIKLTPCLKPTEIQEITIKSGASISELLLSYYGYAGEETYKWVRDLNKNKFDSFEQLQQRLPLGETIRIPVRRWVQITPKPDVSDEKLRQELAKSASVVRNGPTADQIKANNFRDPGEIQFVFHEESLEELEKTCPAVGDYRRGSWPYDSTFLAGRLREELKLYQATLKSRRIVQPLKPTIVGILDSGLSTTAIPEQYLDTTSPEFPQEKRNNGNDDDRNGVIDDPFGATFNPQVTRNGSIKFLPSDTLDYHGTAIADLVLGGSELRRQFSELPLLISLRPINISSGTGRPAPAANIADAIAYLRKGPTQVMNISLSYPNEDNAIMGAPITDKRVGNETDDIFVVAAGNNGRSLDVDTKYPAGFGGPQSDNVITVAASNPARGPWQYSNRGELYVDIFAPGCGISSLDVAGETKILSGTSVAAPIVTFGVSIIRALGVEEARQIKQRIILSGGYEKSLEGLTKYPFLVDIPKAISVRSDIIELTSSKDERQSGKLLVGQIPDEERRKLARFCGDQEQAVDIATQVERLKKIIPNIEAGKVQFYLENANGDVAVIKCKLPTTNRPLAVSTSKGIQYSINIENVYDITLAHEFIGDVFFEEENIALAYH